MVSRQGDFGDEEGKSLKWKVEVKEGYLNALHVLFWLVITSRGELHQVKTIWS